VTGVGCCEHPAASTADTREGLSAAARKALYLGVPNEPRAEIEQHIRRLEARVAEQAKRIAELEPAK